MYYLSPPATFGFLNDANPTRVQTMMWHQHHATTEIYVGKMQRLLEGAETASQSILRSNGTLRAQSHKATRKNPITSFPATCQDWKAGLIYHPYD